MNKEEFQDVIKIKSKDFETALDNLYRKRTGSYYTSFELTDEMMSELVKRILISGEKIWEKKFLEPCVGTGNFIFSYLKAVDKLCLDKVQIEQLVDNIYVADINRDSLKLYEELFKEFCDIYFGIKLDEIYFKKHVAYGLLYDISSDILSYISIETVFADIEKFEGFDIVVTNPPYKNFKAEVGQYLTKEQYNEDKLKYQILSKDIKKKFKYSAEGVINLYKIFTEEIIEKYAKNQAYINILIPSSILSDKTCTKLRTHILKNYNIIDVKLLPENSGYIDAQQALCAILIEKGAKTTKISITEDYKNNPTKINEIEIDEILNEASGNSIFVLNSQEYKLLKKLRSFPTIKELDFIVNARGELDLTIDKKYIKSEITDFSLIRGRNIQYYKLSEFENKEYVSKEFIDKTFKRQYIGMKRLACQQVVNMKKERRVTFSVVDEKNVLGNSCNFIVVDENKYGIDIYSMLGILNSSIINWFFKLTSSNNHVNNYEIDMFPIPVNSCYLKEIGELTKKYLVTYNTNLLEEIEKKVSFAFELQDVTSDTSDDLDNKLVKSYIKSMKYILHYVDDKTLADILYEKVSLDTMLLKEGIELDKKNKKIIDGITDKFLKLKKGIILNHTTFKLSDLDLEMIKPVPQGGNWKNIPQSTVEKSQRLKKISETGGRTTLYGRIDYSKPSYTITTYFNRPGNGTYVHPIRDRVISVREAARLQSFKDDYYFYGNKTQMLKQVGNAIPMFLAYQIGKEIVNKCKCNKSVDLFSGAGGITSGFSEAGITPVICNDFEESACITLKINNPDLEVLCADITKEETKEYIIKKAIEQNADIVCGGPPCQGFSMAGFRFVDDPRNKLFKEFIEVVSKVNPKVVVFENVEGLISFQGGAVYKSILETFESLGYNAKGEVLLSSNYGIPQKRKRVIIICTRCDIDINPEELFPKPITSNYEQQVTAFEAIGDLESVECSDNAKYNQKDNNAYIDMLKGNTACKLMVEEIGLIENVIKNNNGYEQLRLDI